MRNPVPSLTPEQREAANAKAIQSRRVRADVKAKLATDELRLSQVLALSDEDETISRMRVIELLTSVPGVGQVKAAKVMSEDKIAESRRLRGLGPNQRAALIKRFG